MGCLEAERGPLADNQQENRDLFLRTGRNWILPTASMSLEAKFSPEL